MDKDWFLGDLHIHSKFSRACSKSLDFSNLVRWAKIKGLHLLGTGDFTHPLWIEEIKKLREENGFYYYEDFPFIITGEISLIYTQEKGRKVHLVLLVPSLKVAEQINSYLDTKGRRDYDGRPIFGISCKQFAKDLMNISKDIEIIPAHCLLPNSLIHTENGVKKIKDISIGDLVLTHKGNIKRVNNIFVRNYSGKLIKTIPWYFKEGLETTPEHPFLIIKSYKNCSWIKGLCKKGCSQENLCRKKYFLNYKKEWVQAKDIEKGDFLAYPRLKKEKDLNEIDLTKYLNDFKSIGGNFIIHKNARNHTGKIKNKIEVNEKFCRLIGYFLSEGYLLSNKGIGFSFNIEEKEYINEVISAIREIFGFEITTIDSRRENQSDLIFSSKLLNSFFKNFYLNSLRGASNKILPLEFTSLPKNKLVEIFRGWWRGDTGYTVSRQLANQMKVICLRLGIIPSILIDSVENYEKRGKHFINGRKIMAKNDLIVFSNLSFFEGDFGMFKESCFKKFINKLNRKHGWIDEDYAYLPVKKIEFLNYSGKVYNLEVEEDNSYTAEFACVHNCWTPYFGVFGSMAGFDSLKEAFGESIECVHAVETGISSDPAMNWRIKELEKFSIVSFSDAHSFWPWRLGREATIFKKTNSYANLIRQIRENDFVGTIETDPAYGKYHWDGHKFCNFSCSFKESNRIGNVCPVCKRKLIIGVENRVNELAKNPLGFKFEKGKMFFTLLPLHEIISLNYGCGVDTKKVWEVYNLLIKKFGNEFEILLNASKAQFVEEKINEKLINLILKNREGKIKVTPGYDGEYGKAILD